MPVHFSNASKSSKNRGIRIRGGKLQIGGKKQPGMAAGAIRVIQPKQPEQLAFQVVTGKPQGIVRQIAQKLRGSNDLDLNKIRVKVTHQQVTLRGRVATKNGLQNALDAIHSVEGVDRIAYQVKYRNGRQNSGFYSGPHGGGEPPDFSPEEAAGPHGGGGGPDEP